MFRRPARSLSYFETVTQRASRLLALIGASVAVLAAATAVLFFFQPWRRCPYEDTSVGCAMLPHDAAVMVTAFAIAVIGAGCALSAGFSLVDLPAVQIQASVNNVMVTDSKQFAVNTRAFPQR